jgi:hypothetical protein
MDIPWTLKDKVEGLGKGHTEWCGLFCGVEMKGRSISVLMESVSVRIVTSVGEVDREASELICS